MSPTSRGYAQAQLIQAFPEESQDIEFSKIGLPADSVLNGSFEEIKLVFSLPPSWELKPGGLINLIFRIISQTSLPDRRLPFPQILL